MTMHRIGYRLAVGTWSIDSADDVRTELVTLETDLAIGSPLAACRMVLHAPPSAPGGVGGLTPAAAPGVGAGAGGTGGFSLQLRGNAIGPGDAITVTLTSGTVTARVLTASVQSVDSAVSQTRITGWNALQALASVRLNQVYQNQSLRQIVSDLAAQAGVTTGDVETGSTYPYLVVHDARSLLNHVLALAKRDGMDVYVDPDDRLTVKAFTKSTADHVVRYAVDILDLETARYQPRSDRVLVSGESPASNRGADSWHWLAKDLTPFQGQVGQGSRTVAVQDGAVRTKDAADHLANSILRGARDRATWGRLRLLGNPAVKLGDAIEVRDAPKPELNATYKVVSVRHLFGKQHGYVTVVSFTGLGGGTAAGGPLGRAAAQLTGAVGA